MHSIRTHPPTYTHTHTHTHTHTQNNRFLRCTSTSSSLPATGGEGEEQQQQQPLTCLRLGRLNGDELAEQLLDLAGLIRDGACRGWGWGSGWMCVGRCKWVGGWVWVLGGVRLHPRAVVGHVHSFIHRPTHAYQSSLTTTTTNNEHTKGHLSELETLHINDLSSSERSRQGE